VLFEGELAFEAVEDGLDPLPDPAEGAKARLFVLAVGTDVGGAEVLGDECFEVSSGEALVSEDDLPGVDEVVVVFEQGPGDFVFPDFGIGQAPDDGHSFRGDDEVAAESPEETGLGGAVAVVGLAGEIAAFDGFAGGPAGQRCGVQEAEVFMPGGDMAGQGGDDGGDRPGLVTEAGLSEQIREHSGQMLARVADPLSLRGNPEQVLGRRQTQQLSIIQSRFPPAEPARNQPRPGRR